MSDTQPPPTAAAPPAEPTPDELAEQLLAMAEQLLGYATSDAETGHSLDSGFSHGRLLAALVLLDEAAGCIESVFDLAEPAAEGGRP